MRQFCICARRGDILGIRRPVYTQRSLPVEPTTPNMAESLRSSASFDEWDRKEGTPGPMGVTWVAVSERLEFRALFAARHRRHAAALRSGRSGAPGLRTSGWTPRSTNRAGSGIAGSRAAAPKAPPTTPIAWKGGTILLQAICFDPQKILLDPFAPAVFFPPDYDRIAAGLPGPNDGRAPLGVLPRSRTAARDGARAPAAAQPRSDRLRTARQRLHRARQSGVSAAKSRHLRRPGRKDPVPEESGHHRRGTDAGAPVRSAGRQLLGLHDAQLLLAASGLCRQPNQRGRRRRVPRHGGAFHDNGIEVWLDVVYNHTSEAGTDGPTYSYRGIDNQSYYLLTGDRSALPQRHRLRQHAALRPSRGALADSRKPLLLDQQHEGGWLPLRSGLGLHAAVGRRHGSGTSLADRRYQLSRRAPRRPHDRRSLGHRKLSAGPGLSRASTGGSGTASIATICAISCAASPGASAR